MVITLNTITFTRNINRPAAWVASVNGVFFGNFHTDTVARVLRHSRNTSN